MGGFQFFLFPSPTGMSANCGRSHTIFLGQGGGVWTVGDGSHGQLGHGDTSTLCVPQQVKGIPPCHQVAGGDKFSACLTTEGDLYCFGRNTYGQLGQGHTNDLCTPHQVKGLPPIQSVACGEQFVICVGEDSSVWSFGCNMYGQLGIPFSIGDNPVPNRIADLKARQVACGDGHSLILGVDGTVYRSGHGFGSLGSSYRSNESLPFRPIAIPLPFEVQAVYCGSQRSVLRGWDGTIWTADLTSPDRFTADSFKEVPNLKAKQVACGFQHVLVVDEEFQLWGWGYNGYGQLSPLKFIDNPRPRLLREDVQDVMAGYDTTFVYTTTNDVLVCGSNLNGELGVGETKNSLRWTLHPTLDGNMFHRGGKRMKSAMTDRPIESEEIS